MTATQSGSATTFDEVVLSMPASSAYVRLARLVVAGLASRMDFTVDEVDDLRIAIDELCFVLLGYSGREEAILTLRYSVGGGQIILEGEVADSLSFEPAVNPMSAQILGSVCDFHEVSNLNGRLSFRAGRRCRQD